jgi:hypothetical protein
MTDAFNQDLVIENLERALGVELEELPHYDTNVNDTIRM